MSDDTILEIGIRAGVLDTTLDILGSVNPDTGKGEAKIHISEDGLSTAVVDPANVSMAFIEIAPAAFETLPEGGQITLGTNLERLSDLIGKANASDTVWLGYNTETRKLSISYRNISGSMALIDPESIRQEPDTPDLDLPNRVTLPPGELSDAIDMVELVDTQATISCDSDTETLTVSAHGDTDDVSVELGADELIGNEMHEDTEAHFSLEYLDALQGAFTGSEVSINLGDSFPMTMGYQYDDGNATVETTLAPRIKTD